MKICILFNALLGLVSRVHPALGVKPSLIHSLDLPALPHTVDLSTAVGKMLAQVCVVIAVC